MSGNSHYRHGTRHGTNTISRSVPDLMNYVGSKGASKATGDKFLAAEARGDELRNRFKTDKQERHLSRDKARVSLPSVWGTGGRKL